MLKKVLKKIIVVEIALLALLLVKPFFLDKKVFAAHEINASGPTQMIVKITKITLENDGLSAPCTVFTGSQEVDLASAASLQPVLELNCNVAPGTYSMAIVEIDENVTVKGTAILGGTTYYTKTAHTGYTTAGVEAEVLSLRNQNTFRNYFATPVQIKGGLTLRLIVDISGAIGYWNGADSSPKAPGEIASSGGMFIATLPLAVAMGNPGSKEVYDIMDSDGGKGRLSLIFDSSDNFVGGMGRAWLANSNTSSIFYTGGFPLTKYESTSSGINLEASSKTGNNYSETIAWTITSFHRTAVGGVSTGSWGQIYQGATPSGTFTATRVE
ncbi:MAG: hypothetical protein A2452_05095 [Candidatus Firestonebacteria bacterium RIFOXYC2_FULL_39_67]|nr:MAG: hypothetical protein A2536_10660 [Candidatus Firestonebacteria bacterium RIFOXYD2_FULL_39_29]OGF54420.1 MAG: hypothetical protein A2497_05710 [Candidatus Firestonebacteria bacterium RifOxyC12_full_39_7]OGF54501.1 MAG: hypothetical protein A2452_05095 [Candidatus Firestonebacteria bacterium RIFOXYC2_FULL_39_67]